MYKAVTLSENRKHNRINMGCGNKPRRGWINVDIDRTLPNVDLNVDINSIYRYFKLGTVDRIMANDVLQYFYLDKIKHILASWNRIMVIEGTLILKVPDLYTTLHNILTDVSDDEEKIRILFGRQSNKYNVVGCMFTPNMIENLLIEVGFETTELTTDKQGGLFVVAKKVWEYEDETQSLGSD